MEQITIPSISMWIEGRKEHFKDVKVNLNHFKDAQGSLIKGDYREAVRLGAYSLPTCIAIYVAAHEMAKDGNERARELLNNIHIGLESTGTWRNDETILHTDKLIGSVIYEIDVPGCGPLQAGFKDAYEYCRALTGLDDPTQFFEALRNPSREAYLDMSAHRGIWVFPDTPECASAWQRLAGCDEIGDEEYRSIRGIGIDEQDLSTKVKAVESATRDIKTWRKSEEFKKFYERIRTNMDRSQVKD